MKQNEFINELKLQLQGLNKTDIDDIVRDHEEMIRDAVAAGRSEVEIVKTFGNPTDLAKALKAEIKIEQITNEKNIGKQAKGLFGAVGALLVLAPFNLIFVLGPFIALVACVFAGWMVSLGCVVGAVIMLAAFFTKFIFANSNIMMHLSTFFMFIGFMGLALLILFFIIYITKIIFKLILSYFKWNLNFIKNQI